MTERQEPTVSALTDEDTLIAPRADQPSYQVESRSSFGTVMLTLLSLAACGVAGFSYWQLLQAQTSLTDQQSRIVELEKRLSVAGDESAQSLTEVSSQLQSLAGDMKTANEEIRKLWGVSHDTNRKAIAKNSSAIEELGKADEKAAKELAALLQNDKANNAQIEELKKSLAASEVKVNELQKSLAQTPALLAEQAEALRSLEGSVKELNLASNTLKEKLNAQSAELKQFKASTDNAPKVDNSAELGKLTEQVNDLKEAIRAIDVFRQGVNREIILIKERLRAL